MAGRSMRGHGDIPAETDVGRARVIREGAPTIWMETAGEADGRRISVATHHFPKPRFEGIVEVYLETRSMTLALERLGVDDCVRRATRVSARMPSPEDARQPNQPPSRPVRVAARINWARAGRAGDDA